MKLNQKGFGAVEGLLVVIALTLVVGVGFYVVNANKDDKKDEASTSTSEVAKPTETKQTTEQQPQKTDEELVIEAVKVAGVPTADGSSVPVTEAKVASVVGANAKGTASAGGEGSGFAYIAHKTNGKWEVVFRGQQLPGKDIGDKYSLPADWYDSSY